MKIFNSYRPIFVLLPLGSSPFLVLLLFTSITKIPVTTNIICIGLVCVYSLVKACKLNPKSQKIVLQENCEVAYLIEEVNNVLNSLGYKLLLHESRTSRFEPSIFVPFLAEDVVINFAPNHIFVSGPKYSIKHIRRHLVKLKVL